MSIPGTPSISNGIMTIYGTSTQIHPYSTVKEFVQDGILPDYLYSSCEGYCESKENPYIVCPSNIKVLDIHCPINEFYIIPTGYDQPQQCLCKKPDGSAFCSRKLYCSQLEPGVCPVFDKMTFIRAVTERDSLAGLTRCYYQINIDDIDNGVVSEWSSVYSPSEGNGYIDLCVELAVLHPGDNPACGGKLKLAAKKSNTVIIIVIIIVVFIVIVIGVILFAIFHHKKKKK